MRATVVVASLLVLLTACALASAGTGGGTSLTVTYWERGMAQGEPVRWTLRCTPARGTLPRPVRACRKLATAPAGIFAPVPSELLCTQIYGGPQQARVVGTFRGDRVHATFGRADGCELARWNRLSPWLLPAGLLPR